MDGRDLRPVPVRRRPRTVAGASRFKVSAVGEGAKAARENSTHPVGVIQLSAIESARGRRFSAWSWARGRGLPPAALRRGASGRRSSCPCPRRAGARHALCLIRPGIGSRGRIIGLRWIGSRGRRLPDGQKAPDTDRPVAAPNRQTPPQPHARSRPRRIGHAHRRAQRRKHSVQAGGNGDHGVESKATFTLSIRKVSAGSRDSKKNPLISVF